MIASTTCRLVGCLVRRSLALGALPLVLAACGAAQPVLPLEGDWTVDGETIDVDDCDLTERQGSGMTETFDLSGVDEQGFVLGLHDGYEGYGENQKTDCSLEGASFDCEAYEASDTSEQGGVSATLTFTSDHEGELLDEGSLTLIYGQVITCDGVLCADIQDALELQFPCTVQATIAASHGVAEQ